MTVASRIRPIDLEDLSHLDSVGGPFDEDESASAASRLPAWADELLAASGLLPRAVTPVPVELPAVEAIIEVEPAEPEPTPEEVAAQDEVREASIAFELGHRAGFEHGRRDGHADGYRDGLAAGRREALDAGHETNRRLLAALHASVGEHGAQLQAYADELARGATELAFGIAEQILQRELRTAADPGADAIRRAVAALPHAGATVSTAVVRVHPDDVARMVADPEELLVGAALTVVADAEVEPGACVLDVDQTRVDASISSALDRVREVLAP